MCENDSNAVKLKKNFSQILEGLAALGKTFWID